MSATPHHWCYVGMTTPNGQLVYAQFLSLAPTEREAANDALSRFSDLEDGWRVRDVAVFRDPPATFYPRAQSRIIAAEQPG